MLLNFIWCWVVVSLLKDGAPGEIRTPDPLVRSQVLYPAELRAHIISIASLAEKEGFEPSMEYNPHTPLAGERLQPLGHLSELCQSHCCNQKRGGLYTEFDLKIKKKIGRKKRTQDTIN